MSAAPSLSDSRRGTTVPIVPSPNRSRCASPVVAAPAAQRHAVAVVRGTCACVPSGRSSGSRAAPRELDEAALRPGRRARTRCPTRTGRRAQRGAVDRDVRELLGERPVHVGESSLDRRSSLPLQLDSASSEVESNPVGVASAGGRRAAGPARWLDARTARSASSVHDPRRDRGGEDLPRNGRAAGTRTPGCRAPTSR